MADATFVELPSAMSTLAATDQEKHHAALQIMQCFTVSDCRADVTSAEPLTAFEESAVAVSTMLLLL